MTDVWWSILIFTVITLTAAVLAVYRIHHTSKRERLMFYAVPGPDGMYSASRVNPRVPVPAPANEPATGAACPSTLYTYTPTGRDYGTIAGLLIIAAAAVYYLRKGQN